jgi:hypothetical protein
MTGRVHTLAAAALQLFAAIYFGGTAMADNSALRAEAAKVLEAIRGGDLSQTQRLLDYGDAAASALKPFLADRNSDIRREALAVLAALDSKIAARTAVAALADTDPDIRERAARIVYQGVMRHGTSAFPELQTASIAKSAGSSPDAAKLLLLAFVPHSEAALREALGKHYLVKLTEGGPAVEASLPAEVALSRLGVSEARQRLQERIAAGTTAELHFLLDAIAMIDAPEILHTLASHTLGDKREIGGGLPSGASPMRRLTDLAVDAFITRLKLETGVATAPVKLYSPEEIGKVREGILAAIPQ